MADKSYAAAAAPKRGTKSIAINTELTWHFSDAKYKKEKTEKQLQKAAKKQKQNTGSETKETSTVSLDSKTPSLVSLGQTRTPEKRTLLQTDCKRLNSVSRSAIVIKL